MKFTDVNGEEIEVRDGYNEIKRVWETGDIITAQFDMNFNVIRPIPYGKDLLFTRVYGGEKDYTSHLIDYEDETAKNYIAIKRGPLVMAVDSRLGRDVLKPIPVKVIDGKIMGEISEDNIAPYKNIIEIKAEADDGVFYMTDYSSAGKTWSEDANMAAWFLAK